MKYAKIAKQLCLLFFSFIISVSAWCQKKEAYEMMVDGVKVIVQPTNDEIVEIRTIIKGGVQNYTVEKQGIESLAIKALMECGTENNDKNSFKNKLDKVSASIDGYSNMDYASFNLNCIKGDLAGIWPLYADALTKPLFNEKEFDRIKQDQVNLIRSQSSNPDFAIYQMAQQTAFANKDYAKQPQGTESTVNAITAREAKKYFTSIANKNKIFMVIVGDIEKSTVEKMAGDIISKLPEGKPFQLAKQNFVATNNTFTAKKKDFATNYVQGVAGGPQAGTKDFNAFTLAMNIMYDRHFLEVRTNNGLSYAPSSYFSDGLSSYSIFGSSTTNPNKYIQVVNQLIAKTKANGFTDEEVKNQKTSYVTGLFYNQETNAAQAGALASNEVLHNNWRRAILLNDELKPITAKEVSAVFNKYISGLSWVYLGDPTKVNPKLYTTKPAQKLPPSTFMKKKVD